MVNVNSLATSGFSSRLPSTPISADKSKGGERSRMCVVGVFFPLDGSSFRLFFSVAISRCHRKEARSSATSRRRAASKCILPKRTASARLTRFSVPYELATKLAIRLVPFPTLRMMRVWCTLPACVFVSQAESVRHSFANNVNGLASAVCGQAFQIRPLGALIPRVALRVSTTSLECATMNS